MDIKAYIESGILEAYLLGSLPDVEARQVAADIATYPELAAEMEAIEQTMLRFASGNAVLPPAGLQDKIWDAIQAPAAANAGGEEIKSPHFTKVIPLQPEYRKQVQWRYAALVACLIGSIALNFILWNQGNESRQSNTELSKRIDSVRTQQDLLARVLNDYRKETNMMADTTMQTIVMQSKVPGHPMAATVYWSKAKGDTYVAMNALPAPPQGMQYQLWVIQAGKPVSMGTLPNDMASTPGMQKVAMQVTSGDAFAISLEKEGGSQTPTTVYVLGKA